jgi:hypothetical protein
VLVLVAGTLALVVAVTGVCPGGGCLAGTHDQCDRGEQARRD